MTADSPSTWAVKNGIGSGVSAQTTVDGYGNITPQFVVRTNGAPVEAINPFPTTTYQLDVRATLPTIPTTTLNAITSFVLGQGQGIVGFQVTGLSASGAVLTPLFSNDGAVTWHPLPAITSAGVVATITTDGAFRCPGAGHTHVGLQVTTVGASPISVVANASVASAFVEFSSPQPVSDANTALTATAAGTPADAIWAGSGSGSIISVLKGIYGLGGGGGGGSATAANQVAGNAALGTTADAAWSGTGTSSIVAALKALWGLLNGTLKAQIQAGTAAIGSTITTPGALVNSTAVTTNATPNQNGIVVPYSATRKFVHVFSRTGGTETVDLGSSNVAAGTGIPITAGGGFSFIGSGAAGPIYAVTTVASSPLSYVEG